MSTKQGLRDHTKAGYIYTYDRYVRDTFGKKKIVKLNISDLGRAWIRKYATLAMYNIINKMIDGDKIPPM